MSHCISVYLVKKSDIRDSKIDEVINNKNSSEIIWIELGSDIFATPHIPNIRSWGKDKTIAKIDTDYFGGAGEQSGKLFINNKKVYDSETTRTHIGIDEVLKLMGVVRKDGMDEFDTIGLGNFRTNEDFNCKS